MNSTLSGRWWVMYCWFKELPLEGVEEKWHRITPWISRSARNVLEWSSRIWPEGNSSNHLPLMLHNHVDVCFIQSCLSVYRQQKTKKLGLVWELSVFPSFLKSSFGRISNALHFVTCGCTFIREKKRRRKKNTFQCRNRRIPSHNFLWFTTPCKRPFLVKLVSTNGATFRSGLAPTSCFAKT